MAFIPALIAGLGALGGGLSNRGSTQSSTGTSTTNSSGSSNGVFGSAGASSSGTMPVQTPEGASLLTQLLNKFTGMMGEDPNLTSYQNSGISDINKMSNIRNQNLEEGAAARGVFGPAVSTSLATSEGQRTGDIAKFNSGIPLLKNQLQQQMLGLGTTLFSQIPRGSVTNSENYNGGFNNTDTTNTSKTDQSGTVTNPGNVAGGATSGLASILAYLFGRGAFGGAGGDAGGMDTSIGTAHA